MATLKDWLGDGGIPVRQPLAETRASICEICPKNQPGNWWDRLARDVVQIILAQRRAKEALNLHVKCEDDLHFCDVCHCHLPTKVFVPIEHIAKRTNEQTWEELPNWCWMQAEKPK